MLQFGITHWLWLFNRHSLETILKAYQVLLAHFDLLICIKRPPNLHLVWELAVGSLLQGWGVHWIGPKTTKGIISRKFINNFEVGWHLGKFVFGAQSPYLDF